VAEPTRPWRPAPRPRPDPGSLPPDLVVRLRGLRRRLGNNAGAATNRQTRNAYDEALVQVAYLLELPGAPLPEMVIGRRVLTTLERALLEKEVLAAGLDLGTGERPARPALGPGPSPEPAPPPGPMPRPEPAPQPPPPPPSPAPPADPRRVLVRDARVMRRRLHAYEKDDRLWPTKVAEWCEDLDAYDSLLVDLAKAFDLPARVRPAGERRRLLSEERSSIEAGLADAGLDLSPPDAG
jgi:hypothetical protein